MNKFEIRKLTKLFDEGFCGFLRESESFCKKKRKCERPDKLNITQLIYSPVSNHVAHAQCSDFCNFARCLLNIGYDF